MPEATPSSPPSPPRWTLTITPSPDGKEAFVEPRVNVDDVYAWQVVYTLTRVLTHFAAQPGAKLATVAEEEARKAEATLVQSHPARQLFVREGKQLWLGEAALVSHGDALKARGWVDAGPVPEGVQRACDSVRGAEDFAALLGEEAPEAPRLPKHRKAK